jgi:hypothetical protein
MVFERVGRAALESPSPRSHSAVAQHVRLAPVLHEFRQQDRVAASKFVESSPYFYEIRRIGRNTGARRRCCVRAVGASSLAATPWHHEYLANVNSKDVLTHG